MSSRRTNRFTRARNALACAAALSVVMCAARADAEEPKAKPLPAPAEKAIDFDDDINPIFQKNCASCHGAGKQESSFRLDIEAAAKKGGDNGPAIVAGDSANSALIKRVAGADADTIMPPADSGIAKLSDDQVSLLRAWIDQGARWSASGQAAADALEAKRKAALKHWAFQRPQRPNLPPVKAKDWPRNAIDHFVLARLEAAGIPPESESDRYALIRRLSLDLTGLVPTVEEAAAFVNDKSPDAYEQLVERLLASPHYGERWALWWLDIARYADTNGYEIDRPRSIWPYRDWVITAFNANMPFNQFAVEQMAGDLLPHATPQQRIATGFHRNTFYNEEGGHDPEQFRWEAIIDRVSTTGTAFLGLTIGCAQCHDHKYDPIAQNEFYEFFAFLNNDDEPFVEVPQDRIAAERASLLAQIAKIETDLASHFPIDEKATASATGASAESTAKEPPLEQRRAAALEAKFEQWRKQAAAEARHWVVMEPIHWTSKHNQTLTRLDDNSLLASGDLPEVDSFEIRYKAPLTKITGLRLEALPHPSLPEDGPGRGYLISDGTFFLSEINLAVSGSAANATAANSPPTNSATTSSTATNNSAASSAETPAAVSPPRKLGLTHPTASYSHKGGPVSNALDGIKLTGWHTKDGAGRRHVAVFETSEPIALEACSHLSVTLLQNLAHAQMIGHFRISVTEEKPPHQASDMPAEVESLLLKSPEQWSPADRSQVKSYYLSIAPELKQEHKAIEALRKKLPRQPTTMVLEARAEPRVSHKYVRGDFHRPGPEMTPNVPRFLHKLPDGPRNRLSLARWLVDDQNPLIGRVIANQLWQCYFGRGLVATPEDFGTQGAAPTHPELLDWLAREFIDGGWDLKHMHRSIVTSAAYRQSSSATPNKVEVDPENLLISRGPRYRVHAELIRDVALQASGLLNPAIGGPSVFPPQPKGVSEASYSKFEWPTSNGPDRYRRGVYTFRKRTAMYAAYSVFDAPPQNICAMKRIRSNTPLQGLALLNDSAMIEAAQALAAKVIGEGPSDDQGKLRLAFERCLTRPPSEAEATKLTDYLAVQRKRFESDAGDAAKVAGVDVKPDKGEASKVNAEQLAAVDPAIVERAAWSAVARVLLNLDETISKE